MRDAFISLGSYAAWGSSFVLSRPRCYFLLVLTNLTEIFFLFLVISVDELPKLSFKLSRSAAKRGREVGFLKKGDRGM